MKTTKLLLALLFLAAAFYAHAAKVSPRETRIAPLKGERWWGGLTALGSRMPFASTTKWQDMSKNNMNNQIVPLLISSHGRYVWSAQPLRFRMQNDTLLVASRYEQIKVVSAGKTLRDAYLAASAKYFPPTGTLPAEIFFSKPQYNTWIELMYNQNQADIELYADNVLKHGFPAGIFMIDDNWQKYYGNFDFKPEKFPNPKAMTDSLHRHGFKVMLWVCPYVSADSREFRELEQKGYLVNNKRGQTALIHWWNGYSACYDMTNPDAAAHLELQLRRTQEKYDVDGYKFDGGDVGYMSGSYSFHDKKANSATFSQKWAEMGLRFPYNELRTSFKLGGQPLVQRLGDKSYSWDAVGMLIPDMAAAGLLGHLYTCPDMIGGGSFGSFLNIDADKFDQELVVRSCQIHAMMPMMQFSVAPWRILDAKHLEICRKYALFHEKMGGYILECARHSSKSGEPIVRHMEYAFPHDGFVECRDQYMLGDKYLVAPMVVKGTRRSVKLPKGQWKDDLGKTHDGGKTIEIDVPLERLPYFEKVK
jgi:alpha-glucosidase